MARLVPPPPTPEPIAHTSPSLAADMRRCLLQVAFKRSARHRALAARGTAACLGGAAHAVLEAVSKGALDDLPETDWPERLTAIWDQAVAEQAQFAASAADGSLGPPEQWPYYYQRAAQAQMLAADLARCRAATHQLYAAVGTHPLGVERHLTGFGDRLQGQADHIVMEPAGIVVEDYKSAALFESDADDDTAEPQIRSDYRTQLLLYAALYHEETDVWPVLGRLVGLDGQTATVDFIPAEALAAAQEALDLLDRYNAAAIGAVDPWSLASAAPAACSTCAYRGACDPYWTAADPSWEPPDRPSCMGEVLSVDHLGDGTACLTMNSPAGTVRAPTARIRGLTPAQLDQNGTPLTPGQPVRAVRLHRRQSSPQPNELWAGTQTELWVVSPREARQPT